MSNHLFSGLFGGKEYSGRACLIHPDGRSWSYADVHRLSARYASALMQAGVKPGDRVAAQVEKSAEALLLYLGCVRAGAVFLPLNPAYTSAEVEYFIADGEPALFVARPETADALKDIAARAGARMETLGADGSGSLPRMAARASEEWTDVARGPNDLAALLYTSGTTGRSKGAMLTHENLRSNAEALVKTWRFTESDVLIHALPIFHTHGLFVATNVSLMSGATMIVLPKFDAKEILAWMPKATTLMGVPTFYTRLLAERGLTREATADMRLFISGSAPLLPETHLQFRERTGHAILERYGMTETSMNASNPYEGERVAGSVGFPLPDVQLRVTDPQSGEPLGAEEIGMVEIRGPNVFSGYWRMPEKTREEFREDGFFISGDLGRIDRHGYLWIVGRNKDLVISGGFNVYPKEVELEIDALPGVLESAVIGVPHPDLGEAVTAVVVPKKNVAVSEADVIAALRSRLAGYKLPKRVIVVDDLPRNSMAKVQKNVLRETYAALFSSASPGDRTG
jgi:malonyl-CoA/methylmalonyl-CoA synthetase